MNVTPDYRAVQAIYHLLRNSSGHNSYQIHSSSFQKNSSYIVTNWNLKCGARVRLNSRTDSCNISLKIRIWTVGDIASHSQYLECGVYKTKRFIQITLLKTSHLDLSQSQTTYLWASRFPGKEPTCVEPFKNLQCHLHPSSSSTEEQFSKNSELVPKTATLFSASTLLLNTVTTLLTSVQQSGV